MLLLVRVFGSLSLPIMVHMDFALIVEECAGIIIFMRHSACTAGPWEGLKIRWGRGEGLKVS